MRVSFILPVKPFSVNAMYYGDGRTKTPKARQWSRQVLRYISDEQVLCKMRALKKSFNNKKHSFVARLTARYPEEMYYRKAGGISARTMDLSNWEKPLIDLLFLPKWSSKGFENIGIDDKYISVLQSRKVCRGNSPSIYISIAIIDLSPE